MQPYLFVYDEIIIFTQSGQQKTQKAKSTTVEHVSYSIRCGSSYFEDWNIDDDSKEDCLQ